MEGPVQQVNSTTNNSEFGTLSSLPKRKFTPQLTESSSRSSKKVGGEDRGCHTRRESQSREQIKPQLIETTIEHRGEKSVKFRNESQREQGKPRILTPGATAAPETIQKRFTPQLIETAKRSFRQSRTGGPANLPPSRNQIRIAGWRGPLNPRPEPEEDSRFSYANLVRRQERKLHSFRAPDLPAIRSSSSDESLASPVSSLSTSPPFLTHENPQSCKAHTQSRENTPETFTDVDFYSLPARTREKLLKEQALAAFPNEQVHQRVSHFATDNEDDDDTADEDSGVETTFRSMTFDLTRFRRESSVDLTWELEEMRRHKEESEMRARERRFASRQSPFTAAAIAARGLVDDMKTMDAIEHDALGGWQKGAEPANTKRAVRPPMLGSDIVFPQCQSPQTTRCEIDHSPNSHPNGNGGSHEQDSSPLWNAEVHLNVCVEPGLWHGTCKKPSGMDALALPSPKITVSESPPENTTVKDAPTRGSTVTLTNPAAEAFCSRLQKTEDDQESLEDMIQREFNDAFVTQIYNYLSLGYPCLARDYDEELSLVTSISVEELRQNDQHANAKGYLGAPESSSEAGKEGKCKRWTALKLYIHEWARQQPRLTSRESGLEGWGVRARGSWAV